MSKRKSNLSAVKEMDSKHVLGCFDRQSVCLEYGQGVFLYDTEGKQYIDFFGGCGANILGHNHAEITHTIATQSAKLMHISNHYYCNLQANLAKRLTEPYGFEKAFFCNSGAEANECAIKLIKKHFMTQGSKRHKIVTAINSSHGRTLAMAAATEFEGQTNPFFMEGFEHIPFNDIDALVNALDDTVAAIFLPIAQSDAGVIFAGNDYLLQAYAQAKQRGILFVVDEIHTAMGRCGTMFGFQHYGIMPDIVTLSRGLSCGLPFGAVLARGACAHAFAIGEHGSTYGGNPLTSSVALQVLDILENTNILQEVNDKGEYLYHCLLPLKKYNFVRDIRGNGLLQALVLKGVNARTVVNQMAQEGFLINACGNNALRFSPPYIISKEQILQMTTKLTAILDKYLVLT